MRIRQPPGRAGTTSAFERAMAFLDRSIETPDRREIGRARARSARRRCAARSGRPPSWRTLLVVAVVARLSRVARDGAAPNRISRWRARPWTSRCRRSIAIRRASAPTCRSSRNSGTSCSQGRAFLRRVHGPAAPDSEATRRDLALAHLRLGHINRLLEKPDEAAREYQDAIDALRRRSSTELPAAPTYQRHAGDAYNWLGELLPARCRHGSPTPTARTIARSSSSSALVSEHPDTPAAPPELARTLYNRGILARRRPEHAAAAEARLPRGDRLLEPIASADPQAAQELARAYNNLASLLVACRRTIGRSAHALGTGHRDRRAAGRAEPDNREFKLELATFCNNLASLLHEQGDDAAAADAAAGRRWRCSTSWRGLRRRWRSNAPMRTTCRGAMLQAQRRRGRRARAVRLR